VPRLIPCRRIRRAAAAAAGVRHNKVTASARPRRRPRRNRATIAAASVRNAGPSSGASSAGRPAPTFSGTVRRPGIDGRSISQFSGRARPDQPGGSMPARTNATPARPAKATRWAAAANCGPLSFRGPEPQAIVASPHSHAAAIIEQRGRAACSQGSTSPPRGFRLLERRPGERRLVAG
jgi:hypothetical protein